MKVCGVIPTYDNPRTIGAVTEALRQVVPDVFVVDDGSGPEGRAACEALSSVARVMHRATNGGKGAAVKDGLRAAAAAGFTHALQVDADGQHDLGRLPALLEAARANPSAVVLGYPEYDGSAPRVRTWARKFTAFWVGLEVGRGVIRDAMIGFRAYPIEATSSCGPLGDRMDFDSEVAVRLVWAGVPVGNLPVGVRYPEDGVSHFQPVMDNVRFSWLHTRLTTTRMFRAVFRRRLRS